jgi:N-methylhydantoinase B
MTSTQRVDPVDLDLLQARLAGITDEMSILIVRTAYSAGLKSVMDFSAALCDGGGQMIVQGLSLPLHLGSMPDAMQSVLETFGDDLHPGDVVLLNDPFRGGMHLPDIFLFRPIFVDGTRVAFAVVVAHHTDVGGHVPGSSGADSREIYAEGLRLPPVKLSFEGRPNVSLLSIIEANVRLPGKLLADLSAQEAACRVADIGYAKLSSAYGQEQLRTLQDKLLARTERATRLAIGELPRGTYNAVDHIDDAGIDPRPVRIEVSLRVDGTGIQVDFAGSAPQVEGAVNATLSFTKSAVYLAIKSVVAPHVPNNSGFFRPIRVIAPSASVVNVAPPAACAARGVTGYRVADAVFRALAQAVPDRVPAAGEGGNSGLRISGYDSHRQPFYMMDAIVGAWGGRPDRDGVDGVTPIAVNISNVPVEMVEADQPIRVERYGFVPDTGGAGKYRGGLSIVRELRLLEHEATLSIRSDRRLFLPYGLAGGKSGTPSMNVITRGTRSRVLPSKVTTRMREGDVIRHVTAGAGGWGNPLERDTAAVLRDLLDGKITHAYARREYGVVVTSKRAGIDEEATRRLRSMMQQGRAKAPGRQQSGGR